MCIRDSPYAGAGFQIYNPKGELVTMKYTYPTVCLLYTSKQKPNFDRRNDYSFDNESSHKRKDIKADDNKKLNNGG